MKSLITRNRAIAAVLLSLGLLGAGAAQARTDVFFSVGIPAPLYTTPAPVYTAPPVVYTTPAPVYAPTQVYESGAVVVAPPVWRDGRYWEHRRWEERRAWEQRRAWEHARHEAWEHRGWRD